MIKTSHQFFSAICILLLSFSAWALPAGTVTFMSGAATINNENGSNPLAKGSEIKSGDTIETDSASTVQLKMVDGARISLQSNTIYKIDDYAYDKQDGGIARAFTSLVKGVMRTITGAIGKKNKQDYLLKTPTATIGVRGTEFAVSYTGVTLVTMTEGAVNICNNNSNCLDAFAGQSVIVSGDGSPPEGTKQTVSKNSSDQGGSNVKQAESDDNTNQAESDDNVIQVASDDSVIQVASDDSVDPFKPNDTPLVEDLTGDDSPLPSLPPIVTVPPLVTGTGGMGFIFIDNYDGNSVGGLVGGTLTFNAAGALTSFVDGTFPSNTLSAITIAESYNNGVVAWGRWTPGTGTGSWANQIGDPHLDVHYFAGQVSPSANVLSTLSARYNIIGSTAPTLQAGAFSSASIAGTPNLVTGSLDINFVNPGVSYNLNNITVGGQTYSIIGSANIYAGSGFLGTTSTITSTGSGCGGNGCAGIIPFGDAIQGAVYGVNGEFGGATYGFSTDSSEQVTGAIAFQK